MKRILLAALVVLMLFAAEALAEETLPTDIAAYFSESIVLDFATLSDYDEASHCFVLAKAKNQDNVLHYFKTRDGQWSHIFQTASAVPQGSNTVGIALLDELHDINDHRYSGPILTISQLDETDEYTELFTAYRHTKQNQWDLFRIWSHETYGSMLFSDGRVSYYKERESNRVSGSVYGTIQRDLRYVSLSAIPKTLKEARQKYTEEPLLPSGDMTAESIKFSGGRKYAVYSGPGEDYLRSANGKAIVSTNDWIQVFGREGDWILIQYAIEKDHMRFGYIPAEALPRNAAVEDVVSAPVPAYTTCVVSLTDDPLFSQSPLLSLPQGAWVEWLSTMGNWAYVESSTGDLARGFVPVGSLTCNRIFHLEDHVFDSGLPLQGTFTITPEGEIAFQVFWRGENAPVALSVSEGSGKFLFQAHLQPDGSYQGKSHSFSTSWRITPVYDHTLSEPMKSMEFGY